MHAATHLNIMGTRGVPAAHGGFETFAERLALYLVDQGFSVTVYCQSDGPTDLAGREDYWRGIHRVHFGSKRGGAAGTMEFDLACVRHVLKRPGVDLVLGYNTAIFNVLQRLKRRRVFVNMDGIEWKRAKWSLAAKAWLFGNEIIAANLATRPIADHPLIGRHVARRCFRRPVVIPYGGDVVRRAPKAPVLKLGVKPGQYFLSVARIEPENSILQIIQAFDQAGTDMDLLVLGRMDPDRAYHRKVRQMAGPRVRFVGGIYDDARLKAIRFHARAYFHGHQVGGTNPSLVEALGAGNAVIAHDNAFNRWTAGAAQMYFKSTKDCAAHARRLARDDLSLQRAKAAARARHAQDFRWPDVLARYQSLLLGQAAGVQIAAE